MERINPIIVRLLDETQLGFRKGKGTRDGIFLLRNTSERMAAHQKDLFMCFIDYNKTFDRVNNAKLMEVLTKAGVPDQKTHCRIVLEPNGKGKNKFRNYRGYQHLERRQTRMHSLASPLLPVQRIPFARSPGGKERDFLIGENITNVRYADDHGYYGRNT
ncbi:RNA-directed DNA polymerase from mobile element jockey-like [Elysia marginata]|uniref:RNA-directed DNA polymerase from mobile element jockey-like n=1 Tax=Elysia marginata TaxID=1093978 RepID=A0AAV4I6T4_9GAST|nr:RNA-directed DNA polymerase from mobile element jockey-like [Elysia marginata]